jgi:CPA1 family monovalent cation:H+ antiporter
MTTFVVNGLAFLLVGLQLPSIMEVIGGRPPSQLIGLAAAVIVTVIGIRLAWVFPAAYLPRWLVPAIARRDPLPPNSLILVLGWAGLRGAVSLAAALALPSDFPERGLIIFITFAVIVATLVGQGLTLPALIRRLQLGDDGSVEHEEVHARVAANEAALRRLDELVTEVPGHVPLIDQLREQHTHLATHYDHDDESAEGPVDEEERDHETIRRAVLAAKREAVLELRDSGVIGDAALRSVERDLDLEEVRREL